MSDRNLADAISFATEKDFSVVYNDILKLPAAELDIEVIHKVADKLRWAGLPAWIEEDWIARARHAS
jgi:hypothetical protein